MAVGTKTVWFMEHGERENVLSQKGGHSGVAGNLGTLGDPRPVSCNNLLVGQNGLANGL